MLQGGWSFALQIIKLDFLDFLETWLSATLCWCYLVFTLRGTSETTEHSCYGDFEDAYHRQKVAKRLCKLMLIHLCILYLHNVV